MNRMESGLLLRLRRAVRQMSDQHRHLKPILAELRSAIRDGRPAEMLDAFRRYHQAIEAHFTLENETFFPAFHGLHPEHTIELEALDREHGELLGHLAQVGACFEAATTRAGGEALERFTSALADHERREERLVSTLAELSDAS